MTQPLLKHSSALNLEKAMPKSAEPVEKTSDADEFIYLISHDVRSSVRAMLELPQWIAEDLEEAGFEIGGSVKSSIALMNSHTRRLDRMMVDLLTYSRIGRMQTVCDVDLATALDTALEKLSLPPAFTVKASLDCQSIVIGDRDVQTLLGALIDNAVKHHDREAGRITVASRAIVGGVVLTVADDGPGIAPEFHQRVLQPMTTLRSRDLVEGTGLGLACVNKIAELYGGSVRLLSMSDNRGARIEVTLYSATGQQTA